MRSLARVSILSVAVLCLAALSACVEPEKPGVGNNVGNGVHVGYVRRIVTRGEKTFIAFDDIQWFGEPGAATQARYEDDPSCAVQSPLDCSPPNGFYIRNADRSTELLPLATNARILMQTYTPQSITPDQEITQEQFLSLLEGDRSEPYLSVIPFWIFQSEDGTVAVIREQYVP